MSLIAELKRRNVFRVGAAYLVIGWLLLQVADVLLGNFGAPDWVFRSFAALVALGLPLALFLAWAFELTPSGVKRTETVDAEASIAPRTGRRLDRLIVLALLGIIVVLLVERVWFADAPILASAPAADVEAEAEPAAATPSGFDKSIAVLPFSDFSPGGDRQWFADGLSEEILNALVRVPDLLVAARTSSFAFRDSGLPIPEIAAELGVAHVLEGSVRMSDERIRVTAQLIRAADGFHVWSNNFDRETDDIIGIQEDLARQISAAMETTMDPEALAAMAEAGTRSVEAYTAYIRARGLVGRNRDEGYALLEQARRIDPDFAAAHYRAAMYWAVQSNLTSLLRADLDLTPAEVRERLQERIAAAIRTADDPLDATLYRSIEARAQLRLGDATRWIDEYVTRRPGDHNAWSMAIDLALFTGNNALFERALAHFRERVFNEEGAARQYLLNAFRGSGRASAVDLVPDLLARWPDDTGFPYQAQRSLLWVGRIEEAREYHDRFLERPQWLRSEESRLILQLRQACAEGRVDEALALLDAAPVDLEMDATSRWLIADILSRRDESEAVLKVIEAEHGPYGLVNFLLYPQFDPRPYPSLVRVLEREGIPIPEPLPLPFACPPTEPQA